MSGEATSRTAGSAAALEHAFGARAVCNRCGAPIEDYRVVAVFLHAAAAAAAVRAYCRGCYFSLGADIEWGLVDTLEVVTGPVWVEPGGFERLVKYIRVTEASLGDGVKRVYESEKLSMKKLRRVNDE